MNTFDPNVHLNDVVIVGLGGTGAQLARSVARLVYAMRQARLHAPSVRFIDPDVVAEKNVGRQLFSYGDIGTNKAHTLAARFNAALGLSIAAIDQPVNAARHFERHHGTLLIGAVDNELARRELAQVQGAVWMDCGNFRNAGQVVLGNTADRDLLRRHLDGRDGKYAYLPNAALLFPQLLEPEPPSPQPETPASCADLVALGEQALFVNDLMAAVAAQYVYKLLYRQSIHTFASFVDGDLPTVRSLLICRDELNAYLNL